MSTIDKPHGEIGRASSELIEPRRDRRLVRGVDGAEVAQRERDVFRRVADGAPEVDDLEAAREEVLRVVAHVASHADSGGRGRGGDKAQRALA